MFDSPIAYCPVTRRFIRLDQAQRECAREHDCPRGVRCPFQRYFVKYCPVREAHVVLDRTHRDCALEHGCEGLRCPLRRFFARLEGSEPPGPTVPAMDLSIDTPRLAPEHRNA